MIFAFFWVRFPLKLDKLVGTMTRGWALNQLETPKTHVFPVVFPKKGTTSYVKPSCVFILGSDFGIVHDIRPWEEIAMNVSRKEMTFIDRFRENLYLDFFFRSWFSWRSDEHVGIVKKQLFVFIQHGCF